MRNPHTINVIGGGLGGLAAAALVARAGHPVVVHEQRNRLGGNATTDERDGFRFNQGPHALYRNGAAHEVLTSLGIRPRGTVPPTRATIMRDGDLHVGPGGPWTLLRTRALGMREKLETARLLGTIQRVKAQDLAHVSAAEWVDGAARWPRVRELVHTLLRLTTYVNDPETVSAEVGVMQLQGALGSGVLYLHGGWQQLVDALAGAPGVTIASGEPCRELPDGAATIVAVGSPPAAGALVDTAFEVGPPAQVSCLDLGLRGEAANDLVLGVDTAHYLSNHSIAEGFAPRGDSHVAVVEYLAPGREPDRARLDTFRRRAGIPDDQVVTERYLHRMTAVTAIPTAAAGGLAGRPAASVEARPGTFVVGDWVGPEGHLADGVFASARDAARAAVAHASAAPVVG